MGSVSFPIDSHRQPVALLVVHLEYKLCERMLVPTLNYKVTVCL